MEIFGKGDAYQLIKAALESKVITLVGSNGAATPTKAGELDAEYLKALYTALLKNESK